MEKLWCAMAADSRCLVHSLKRLDLPCCTVWFWAQLVSPDHPIWRCWFVRKCQKFRYVYVLYICLQNNNNYNNVTASKWTTKLNDEIDYCFVADSIRIIFRTTNDTFVRFIQSKLTYYRVRTNAMFNLNQFRNGSDVSRLFRGPNHNECLFVLTHLIWGDTLSYGSGYT